MRQDVEDYKWPEHPHAVGADNPQSVADRIRELQDVTKHMGGLWRATAVPGTAGLANTADIIKLFSDTEDALGDALANVWVPAALTANVDDLGTVQTLPNGVVAFLPFGPSAGAAASLMILASVDMPTNDTDYACLYLAADGTTGAALTCRRPYGTYISAGDVGFLGQGSAGNNIFHPANMREEAHMPFVLETRIDDPAGAAIGRIWYRTDL